MTAGHLLVVHGLHAGYGKLDILHDVSLAVNAARDRAAGSDRLSADDRPRESRDGRRAVPRVVADRAYVLELGRNRFEGPGQRLLTDREVKRLYLGG